MKKYYLGIDLGSTTSKAVIINEKDEIIGRGITNTRANYEVAADIARLEAIYNARFSLLKERLADDDSFSTEHERYISDIENVFQFLQFKNRLDKLRIQLIQTAEETIHAEDKEAIKNIIHSIFDKIEPEIRNAYMKGDLGAKSEFFRDIIGERYHDGVAESEKKYFEELMVLFDKSITPVENEMVEFDFKNLVHQAMEILDSKYSELTKQQEDKSYHFDAELNLLMGNRKDISNSLQTHIDYIAVLDIHIANMTGTGYGRALLPFPEESIKSEILCHAFGAHAIFPNTRTVLDIGGQDTKAIQADKYGLVTSFHMNDRCAAGCGRYLGYIADELNISLNELGPLAMDSTKEVNICSTCTVFAGAEIRELINVGEKREDILAGLHKAIVMRAMSLIARSGGVRNEFTFTGGVARNQAVLKYVTALVKQNYGDEIIINIHVDSIFMGALGAAMFSRRGVDVDLPEQKRNRKELNVLAK